VRLYPRRRPVKPDRLLDTLSRYADRPSVRAKSIRILERGLRDIQRIVQAGLLTYQDKDHFLQRDDLEDLRLLIRPQLERRCVQLGWRNEVESHLDVPAVALRHAILNLLLNAVDAVDDGGRISFHAKADERNLDIAVTDSGRGMPPKFKTYLEAGNAATPLEAGRGLGLWMVRRFMEEVQGTVIVNSPPEGGTKISLAIPLVKHELQNVA
jgi:signal transduction histidine kinase